MDFGQLHIDLRSVSAPLETIRQALDAAIDADDDILTQSVDAETLRRAIARADSFHALVSTLRKNGAID